ncbi:ABC transporter permease [Polyangium sp. 15x6]|uniref:ABC transporter permease n=1 Tax=Polyangium sp. 15x6 TaxID=3042687 RepID=UPI00249B6DCF|nr:ABC transporter permease [Polyangium sp. 15x6]MDI3288320.1 ABC transporter permease [Polyangium sp. 15x6]
MWLGYLVLATRALGAHRTRSLLTISSIMIGAFTIVFMMSLAEGGLETLVRGIEEIGGARLVLVTPKEPERAAAKKDSYPKGITRADRAQILAALPHVAGHTAYASLGKRDIVADTGETARADLVAADAHFLDAYRMDLARGRPFSDEEDLAHAGVCVVGPALKKSLWSGEAVGRKLTVGGFRCRVIGEIAPAARFGVSFGFDWQNLLVVPAEAMAAVEPATRTSLAFLVKTDDPRSNDVVKRIVNAILESRHHHIDDFTIFDFSGIMGQFRAIFLIMQVVVGFIAAIALVVGGVGIMNMMLVSVSERVREIGIRKALGASPGDIGAQFLCEALLLSALGGALGVGLGAVAAMGASALLRGAVETWAGGVSTGAAAVALCVSVGIGALFGFFPARRASRLVVVEALRR